MKISNDIINEIFGIKESYELPLRLMALLENAEDRETVFKKFLEINNDLSYDWFTDYFQEGSSNRKKMMQDFTPKEVTSLLPKLLGDFETCLDVCAGTGGLTIGAWNVNHNATFYCEELSTSAFPLLLFNLAIRNVDAFAANKNVLTGEIFNAYKLEKGENFSKITICENYQVPPVDICVINPPYSLSWKYDEKTHDVRFNDYGYPPTSKADYGFVLHGLHYLKNGGKLGAILPHGVLFRGQKEKNIREKLIENGTLRGIIGLPEKLFLNTGIPVCLMTLEKNADNNDFLVIDASREFEKGKKQNFLTDENCKKIIETYYARKNVDKYAAVVDLKQCRENEYNLNIPRYVNTFEKEPAPDVAKESAELLKICQEIKNTEREIYNMMLDLDGLPYEALECWRKIANVRSNERCLKPLF